MSIKRTAELFLLISIIFSTSISLGAMGDVRIEERKMAPKENTNCPIAGDQDRLHLYANQEAETLKGIVFSVTKINKKKDFVLLSGSDQSPEVRILGYGAIGTVAIHCTINRKPDADKRERIELKIPTEFKMTDLHIKDGQSYASDGANLGPWGEHNVKFDIANASNAYLECRVDARGRFKAKGLIEAFNLRNKNQIRLCRDEREEDTATLSFEAVDVEAAG